MNRQTAQAIERDIDNAIVPILTKYNVAMTKRSGSFSSTELSTRIVLTDKDAANRQQSLQAQESGLKLEQVFTDRGCQFKVKSFLKGRDFTWTIAERLPDGKQFRFRPQDIVL